MNSNSTQPDNQSGHKPNNTALKLVIAAVAMFGFGFALVPLYDIFCEITGINGKTAGPVERVEQWVDTSRTITVQFITTNNAGMPWEFEALQEEVITLRSDYKKLNDKFIETLQGINEE